jgi:hypothetical protein
MAVFFTFLPQRNIMRFADFVRRTTLAGAGFTVACSSMAEPPGPPANVVAVTGGPVSIAAGASAPDSLAVKVVDARGKGVPNIQVNWTATPFGRVSIRPTLVVTDGRGVARTMLTAGSRPGDAVVSASATTISGPLAVSVAVSVTAGPMTVLKVQPTSLLMGVSQTQQLSASGFDAQGNAIANPPVSWSSSDASIAEVSSTGAVTGKKAGSTTIVAKSGTQEVRTPVEVTSALLADNFDTENGGVEVLSYTGFRHWNVVRGSVDLIGNGSKHDFLPGNGLYVDLDGHFAGGRLESKSAFILNPGTYTLQFKLAGSQRDDINVVTVRLGELFAEQFTLASATPFTTYTRTIQVNQQTTARLSFDQAGSDGLGALLDAVKLERK